MNLDDIINSMTPEVYQRLSTAVELGKWGIHGGFSLCDRKR